MILIYFYTAQYLHIIPRRHGTTKESRMSRKSDRKVLKKAQQVHWDMVGLGLDPPASNLDELDVFHLSSYDEPDHTWEDACFDLYWGNRYE
jgi:hypothetical protein